MSVDDSFMSRRSQEMRTEELERKFDQFEQRTGGGNGGGGMDQRIGRLEGQVDRIGDKLDRLNDRVRDQGETLAALSRDVHHLPSKGFIVTSTALTISLLTGILLFGDRLLALVGT
ncbi:hypothetical protein [Qipengyuania sp.]|uniref:hypothetical protein n=1 Tax=Qipengyuania sp. TaxID=2004515 RepID=UPI0035C7A51B